MKRNPPPENAFTYTWIVSADAIDFNGHVNNMMYLQWMMEATMHHSHSVGCDADSCRELGGLWVARTNHIEYKREAFEGETLRMHTWIAEFARLTATRRYQIVREADRAIVATGYTEWVFVDNDTHRPMRVPEGILALFDKT